jgi:hypothetical protein
MEKLLTINDRGYVYLAKVEGTPDFSKAQSFDVVYEEDKNLPQYAKIIVSENDDLTFSAGNMNKKGYFNVGTEVGKESIVVLTAPEANTVQLTVAKPEDIDRINKAEAKAREAKKAAKKTGKRGLKAVLEQLVADGTVVKLENDRLTYAYKDVHTVEKGQDITCLRKAGTFKVTGITDKIVEATDASGAGHFFDKREVAPAS